ncbi:MAG: cytochrome c oxidase subunit II [Acidimicrobiales bacterium]
MSRRLRILVSLTGLVLFLAACSDERQDVFSPEGDQAEKINDLQVPVFIAAGVVGVFVFAAIAYAVVKFRSRGDAEEHPDPVQVHGNFKLEVGWTIAPAVILSVVAFGTLATVFDISDNPAGAMRVKVYGQQWWWSYEYDLDGDADNGAEIVTANDLVIPAGEPVVLELRSRDVIHSFWIPALAGTRDMVPGRVHQLTIEADQPGIYDGQCKEFCGLSHANMRARVVALSESEFDTWLDQQQEEAQEPTGGDAEAGAAFFASAACSQCHQIRGVNDPLEVDEDFLVAGHAPDLTHFMSRGVFASGLYPLYQENGEVNRTDLEEWLRNPHALIPMAAPTETPGDGPSNRGMPDLNLSEDQIDQLVAYLETLGPQPPRMEARG